jgi:hypothetical protein
LHGNAQIETWKSEHLDDERSAAWAFVRKLLSKPGEYVCSVTVAGFDVPERRVINVELVDGVLFRIDKEHG